MTESLTGSDKGRFNPVEASIIDIRYALGSGATTAVGLAAECLPRISRYDCRGPSLNAIPLLNPNIFKEAAASDDRRTNDLSTGLLDGIPYTVKDSYKVQGMTVASGSPALQHLVANEDSYIVQQFRKSGGVLLGLTNTPPMMYGGMQRGVLGRAENPYNKEYLAAAFASGSSNGSGVSTATSMTAFGMGSETVSSGRSPASNNGLVAYTPSRGLISVRGIWPLYPTCDVVVPHTRTMNDLFEVLDVITQEDKTIRGDFWRSQPFVPIPRAWKDRPQPFKSLADNASLKGVRIAVPSCYIGGAQLPYAQDVYTSPEMVALWGKARADLEANGAEVIVVNEFPIVQVYENPDCASQLGLGDVPRLPQDWNSRERGPLIARSWDAFLRDNADANLPDLSAVDALRLFPAVPPDHPQIAYAEPANAVQWSKLTSYLETQPLDTSDPWQSLQSYPDLKEACQTLEAMRKHLFEDWLARNNYDMVAFPAAGDVGRADANISHPSAKHAWTNGVKYSNGNRAIRHMGVPSVTVTMGVLEDKGIPAGLTFLGPAYSDEKLLRWAKAFEDISPRRKMPGLTPVLPALSSAAELEIQGPRPELTVDHFTVTPKGSDSERDRQVSISLNGTVSIDHNSKQDQNELILEIFIDSERVSKGNLNVQTLTPQSEDDKTTQFSFKVQTIAPAPPKLDEYEKTEATVARDQNMVVVLAYTVDAKQKTRSKPAGWFALG